MGKKARAGARKEENKLSVIGENFSRLACRFGDAYAHCGHGGGSFSLPNAAPSNRSPLPCIS